MISFQTFLKRKSPDNGARDILLLAAALLIYSGGQLWQNISWPPFYSFDETLEIDYVYQITQGHLPTFFGGVEFNPLNLHYQYAVQWRYQHPPLFYLIEVPVFVMFDTLHHPIRGIWAMRALIWVLGVILIICSRWAAYWIWGHRCLAASLVPVVVAANRCFPSVVFNYTFAALWVTLLIGMSSKLIRILLLKPSEINLNADRNTIVLWWLIVALAPLTRLSTIPIMGLCLLMLFIAMCLRPHIRIRHILLLVIGPGATAVASSAWFYIRLYRLSGNFTGSQPEWSKTHLHRDTHKSFISAVSDPDFYKNILSQYQNSAVTNTRFGWVFIFLLTIIPLCIGIVALIARIIYCHIRVEKKIVIVLSGLLFLALGGTLFQQLLFYMQGGSDNAVYLSLISVVLATILCYGFTEGRWPRASRMGIILWLAIRGLATVYEAKLKWPFAQGGTMERAGHFYHIAGWGSLLVIGIGLALSIIATSLDDKVREYTANER